MDTLDRRTLVRRGLVAGGGLAALGPLRALGADVAHGKNPRRAPGYGPLNGSAVTYAIWGPWKKVD